MIRKLLSLFNKVIRLPLVKKIDDKREERRRKEVLTLYKEKGYLDAYSEHTDIRVKRNSKEAVGGMWEKVGKHQFDFLVNNGLLPHHRLLDIGCGTLRGGRHFIKYLSAEKYTGIDISTKAIEYSKHFVEREGLSEKEPRLLVSRNKDLRFKEFDGEVFDYLLAQSVFTHLKPEHIEECFRYITRIMNQDSVFFFTFFEGLEFKQTSLKDFQYPFSFFKSIADKYGFNLKDCSEDYKHPRGQHMARSWFPT